MDVPAILTSGDHGAVERWRREQAHRADADRAGPTSDAERLTGRARPCYTPPPTPVRVAIRTPTRSHGCPDESGTDP